eukprot:TRINITY_DN6470_c0_g1_i2.p1 TRINITY_DN6470_c0_g1~~TRINITY_DN6470_c0_g1_i2.p1  ORF type:complete len:219 (-),score=39.66 TRINITY_DN6470_c0_g1_i2:176-832(-)
MCASEMLASMLKYEYKKAEGYKQVLLLCMRLCSAEKKAKFHVSIIKTLLEGFLKKRAKCIQLNFFTDYFAKNLDVALHMFAPLIKLTFPKEQGGARTEFQRKMAQKLTVYIMKKIGKSQEQLVVENLKAHYGKLSALVMEGLEIKVWKKPMKYWQMYSGIFAIITQKLIKESELPETESLSKARTLLVNLINESKQAANLKSRLQQIEALQTLSLIHI